MDGEQHQVPLPLPSGEAHEIALPQHERLLAENVPTALQGGDDDLEMGMWRSANVDKLEIGRQIREEESVAAAGNASFENSFQPFGVRIDACDNSKLRRALPSRQMAVQATFPNPMIAPLYI